MINQFKLLFVALYFVLITTHTIAHNSQKEVDVKKITLMLEWFVNPNHGPIIIAQQKGFFKEEGLKVIIQEPSDPSLPPKLVAAGDVDLAVYYQPSLMEGISRGLPIIWAGTLIDHILDGVIVLDEGPIKSLKDLKGKKIGTSNGKYKNSLLNTLFETYGFTAKDIKIISVGWNLAASLMSGQVDAIIGGYRNFEMNLLKINNMKGRMFYYEENGIPPYDEIIFITHKNKHNKENIRRFLRCIQKASQYITNNKTKSWTAFRDYNPKQLDNKLNEMAWKDTIPHFSQNPAARNIDRYELYSKFLISKGGAGKPITADKMMIDL